MGLRGVAKTVVLNKVQNLADDRGYQSVYMEAYDGLALANAVGNGLHPVLLRLDRIAGTQDVAKRGLRVLRSFASAFQVSIQGLDISVTPSRDDPSAFEWLFSRGLFAGTMWRPDIQAATRRPSRSRRRHLALVQHANIGVARPDVGAPHGRSHYPSTPTARAICRRMATSCSVVMQDGVAARRALDVVATRCDTAQHGLVQPFSGVGAIATERSGMASVASSVSGTRMAFG